MILMFVRACVCDRYTQLLLLFLVSNAAYLQLTHHYER